MGQTAAARIEKVDRMKPGTKTVEMFEFEAFDSAATSPEQELGYRVQPHLLL